MISIKRALISVFDKQGVAKLAQCLKSHGVEIVATGNTAKALRAEGIAVKELASLGGAVEALNGRVKTLHAAVMGSILCDRTPKQLKELVALQGKAIDMVVVNFYPFADALKSNATKKELVEKIDIGGPTMVRSAAKNHEHVAVICDPTSYQSVIEQLAKNKGKISEEFSFALAAKAFNLTYNYDLMIANYFSNNNLPNPKDAIENLAKFQKLRYGENPHQDAFVNKDAKSIGQLNDVALSYNNIVDAVAASRAVFEHEKPCCVVLKHATPCGVAVASDINQAVKEAIACDPESAFGGVIACNRELDEKTLTTLCKKFIEVLICPSYPHKLQSFLKELKRIRVITGPLGRNANYDVKALGDISLVQQQDTKIISTEDLKQVSKLNPTLAQLDQLLIAWKVAKYVKSNAIVLVRDAKTIGIGTGQPSRVLSVKIAIDQARKFGFDTNGAVAASDGFFPYADGLELLAAANIKAVIQPGGSKRDDEVINAADTASMVMMHSKVRHFNH